MANFFRHIPVYKKDKDLYLVVLAEPNLESAVDYIESTLKPWCLENLSDDCWCVAYWRTDPDSTAIVGFDIKIWFRNLSDATLFRLRF